jgi:hypothetical protein
MLTCQRGAGPLRARGARAQACRTCRGDHTIRTSASSGVAEWPTASRAALPLLCLRCIATGTLRFLRIRPRFPPFLVYEQG